MDKFAAMQAFVRVVEAGSFSRAADLLALPKPTVTRLIQHLESHLATKLLNRTTRRVTVTSDGAAYYERVLRVLGDVDELESSMSLARADPRGRLRVDVAASVARLVLIPALPRFHARYPGIQIDLGVGDRPVDLLGENIDCVIRAGVLSDQSLVARRVAEFRFIAAAAPAYLKQHGMPRHPRELEDKHTVVGYFSARTGRPMSMDFTRDGERVSVQGRYVLAVNDSNAYIAAAVAGLGIAQSARFMLQSHIAAGELEPVLPQWCSDPLPIHVVYPPNRHLSAKLRVFVDWVAEVFASDDLMQCRSSLPRHRPSAAAQRQAAAAAQTPGHDAVTPGS